MHLDDRKFLILQAIIDDYISTAMPVGSRTISRKSGVGFSPATIRNEMSDLEELGYLDQPHTSAGRVPSDKAYRLYVDRLLKVGKLSEDESERMHDYMQARSAQVDGVIRSAAQVLADATQYTSVIVAPKLGTLRIQHIQLVPVATETALMIIVTNLGIVKDAVIRVPDGLDADDLYSISRMLTQRLANKPLDAVRQTFSELLRDTENNRRLMGETLRVIEKKLEAEDSTEVFIGGSSKLLNYPEYSDVQKAKNFLAVLESKDKIRRLIGREGGMEVTIRIGAENDVPEMSDCSIVTACYKVGDLASGTLGIIGPTRMNYNRVIPVLEFMSRAMSEILTNRKA
ncbi:MAG: heat-inducible transcription repressor HrcA [Clostridia bacterium]|nr:heat-inducible transcription repressor HrcA [Clostridia bacterium]MBP3653538.1 heat-inducible transcription repressor HrcA [Clostridia bacterium]